MPPESCDFESVKYPSQTTIKWKESKWTPFAESRWGIKPYTNSFSNQWTFVHITIYIEIIHINQL